MADVRLTNALRDEYVRLFETCEVDSSRARAVQAAVDTALAARGRYDEVSASTSVPWYVVAAIHAMESSARFDRHLHNGDPLTARTVHVPAGRPKAGAPPFKWEASAADALALRRMTGLSDWSLAAVLYRIEGYNGWGYRLYHPDVLTPYLWSFSQHYESGKYVADGEWSASAVSDQCGAATMLRRMVELELIEFEDRPLPADEDPPLIVQFSAKRPTDSRVVETVKALQRWLNTHPGIFVNVDGWPAERTSDAYWRVTGQLLPGDPRG